MGTMTDVASILASSPLASRLNASDADTLSLDMTEIGRYLAMLVEELRTLHDAVLALAARIDEIDR